MSHTATHSGVRNKGSYNGDSDKRLFSLFYNQARLYLEEAERNREGSGQEYIPHQYFQYSQRNLFSQDSHTSSVNESFSNS